MAKITLTESKFLNELVKDCITYRLTENEALKYIEIRFKKISISSYTSRKAHVLNDKSTNVWLNHFTRIGFVASHKIHLENIQRLQNDSLRRLFIEQNQKIRNERLILQLKNDIRENTKLLSELSLGTPIIAEIKAKMQQLENQNVTDTKTLQIST
jgi:hypothetical protein